jgi:16S rRNA (cytidine1402-2'-O)-methyltransferase
VNKLSKLFLLPNTLGGPVSDFSNSIAQNVAIEVNHFIVEEVRSARRLLRGLGYSGDFEDKFFYILNQHTDPADIPSYILPWQEGNAIAVISEAGVPCVADPGHQIVELAHQNQVRVIPVSGPSSILMALMASGLSGQKFTFNGYLPREKNDRIQKFKQMEAAAFQGETQLFMDTPFRNDQSFEEACSVLKGDTYLCIATNLTNDDEMITTKTIDDWKSGRKPVINKKNVMFVLGRKSASTPRKELKRRF